MSPSRNNALQTDPVLAALNEVAVGIRRDGPRSWRFSLAPAETGKVTARVEGEWLLMDSPVTACRRSDWLQGQRLWELLYANAGLPAGAKFVVAGNPPTFRVRAEVPVVEETDLAGRMRSVCLGFQEALRSFRGLQSGAPADRTESSSPATPGPEGRSLSSLCEEAGWPFSQLPHDGLAVNLEVPDGFHRATVRRDERGSPRLWVNLARKEDLPRQCRKALGIFLLRACAQLKTVRAAARDLDPGTATAGFEAVLEPWAGPWELGCALGALSVACSLSGKEAKILCEEVVGNAYLTMVRGWSPGPGRSNTNQAP